MGPMLGIFRTFRNRFRAIKAADQIARLLVPAFVYFRGPTGELDKKMRTDEFLLSYMYGVFVCAIDVRDITDDMQRGFTLWECFDRFFPGEGKQVLSLCNLRVESGDEQFDSGVAKGYKEMMEVYKSEGQSTLPSLRKHLVRHYAST